MTGNGPLFYRGPPDETSEHPAIRRDFSVDRLELRWNVDAAALAQAYGPDYRATGETRFSNPVQLCDWNSSSWDDSDCDRAGLRAVELSYAGRRLFAGIEISAIGPRTCCRYFFDLATDSLFSAEGFVPLVDAPGSSFARGLIGPDDGAIGGSPAPETPLPAR